MSVKLGVATAPTMSAAAYDAGHSAYSKLSRESESTERARERTAPRHPLKGTPPGYAGRVGSWGPGGSVGTIAGSG